ncbi:hypothetical protein J5N97_018188 [Dioscorea zingiberensis]|uniref:Helicase C-terminal domain-containing protein n=1 Tax=Dioscorea zingiberensis TaxID=325984 RepID=A0A9D5CPL8_9LILI|nr:hypothetical protein J5N97_018188 [Dioscorea zingiberensis]
MAKSSESEDALSLEDHSCGCGCEEDEQIEEVEEEELEELEAVNRDAEPEEDEDGEEDSQSTEEEDKALEASPNAEIGKQERERLREMQRLKKQKLQEILDAQNAAIDADMNKKRKGQLKYLLQQTEVFAHFAQGNQAQLEKKPRGRGRHASKLTEEEEDEECLKEEGGFSSVGGTRLVSQPSCIQGKMRSYQLAGLNWLIRLYENGINGILADEMNNLHELWSLLNFLLPEIFSSAETFDEWFQISDENDQHEVVQQLHKILRPFLLRRLKSDVEKGLPPKKETILKVGMSQLQKQYYRALLQKDLELINAGGECKRLLNIAVQLRKCCNHPYLFQGAEPGPPYTSGEHLITNSGKMVLLDKLLPKLKERGSRVLIFSQMTRLLDILEDYLMFRGYLYCRIDGSTCGEDRDASIDTFNLPGSDMFIFLLSTRAGGLGINLATADVVILYDSDWNPQIDLQAQDRAHRIGQKKEVQVFRFCTEYTIEEKVIERAYKKLALDALVIQQGRLAEHKTVNKDELLRMVKFGAEMVFSSKDSTITDEDIDRIIAKGEETTAELDAKMKKFTEDAIKFKMDDIAELYDFDNEKDENKSNFKKLVSENCIDLPKRERKRTYLDTDYYKQTLREGGSAKPRERKIRMPQLHDFQFFNTQRLTELFEKEARFLTQTQRRNQLKDTFDGDKAEDYDRIIKNIERGEARISRKDEIMQAIGKKMARYKDPWSDLKIQYGQNKGNMYNEECDRFMLCMVHKLGYGNWDELKFAFRESPMFRFDWFVKSRTPQELAKRCDTLIRLIEKENQEYDEQERQAAKDKMHAKVEYPSTSSPEVHLFIEDVE